MDYLRTFAEEYGLKEIVSVIAERPNVQGAILRIDELWLMGWRYAETGRDEEWVHWVRIWDNWWGKEPFFFIRPDKDLIESSWIPQRQPDLWWRPPHWDYVCHMAG